MNRIHSHKSPSVLDVRDPYSQFYQGPHHGKHWYLWHPDDIGTAKPMNEVEWFKAFQPLLLRVINTGYGRQLMGINPVLPPIQHITKNAIHYYLGERQWQSQIHIGAKWANVIRYRWPEFKRYARFFYYMPHFFTLLNINGLAVPAHATSTFYPDPDTESSSVDGAVMRVDRSSSPASVWSTDRNHSTGTSSTDSWENMKYMLQNQRDAGGTGSAGFTTVWEFIRNWFVFDTSSITDTHVVSATVLTLTGADYTAHDETNADLTFSGGTLESNTAVGTGDYDGYAALNSPTEFSSRFDVGSWSQTGANDITFNADGRAAVSLDGVTTILQRISHDVDNDEPDWEDSWTRIYSRAAEQSGTSEDPKLVVTHALPPPELEAMNGIALASIQAVNGITAANAEEINGIDF